MQKLINFFILLVLCVSSNAFAQTPKYRPLTTSPFKNVLYISQEVDLDKRSHSFAKIGPLLSASGGFGANRFVVDASGYDTAAMPMLNLSNPTSQATALAAAHDWVEKNGRAQIHYMHSYMRQKNLSS